MGYTIHVVVAVVGWGIFFPSSIWAFFRIRDYLRIRRAFRQQEPDADWPTDAETDLSWLLALGSFVLAVTASCTLAFR